MFSDIHTHILYSADDGAKSFEDAAAMIEVSYKEGTRLICMTPHFFPAFFGNNSKRAEDAFNALYEYCRERYPDLELIFGNELGYKHDCVLWLQEGFCRPIGDTNYILAEFLIDDSEDKIAEGICRLQNAGYVPIIAHAERYKKLSVGRIGSLRENGAMVQINASSVLATKCLLGNSRIKKLIKKGYVDFVASDAHDMKRRPPELKKSYGLFVEKYGKKYADNVYCNTAMRLFSKNKESEGM